MSLNAAVAFLQSACRALHDDAVWVDENGGMQAITGIYQSDVGTPLDPRAEPVVPTFRIILSDAPGIAVGDEVMIGVETFQVTKVIADRVMDEALLELRRIA